MPELKVWDGTQWVGGGYTGFFLPLAGGTMTGPIKFTNSTDDLAGQVYAFDGSGREILIVSGEKVANQLDASRIQIYGNDDTASPRGIQYYAYAPADIPSHRFFVNDGVGTNEFLFELTLNNVIAKKPLQAVAGSGTIPSYGFEDETGLGWYRFASGQVGFISSFGLRQRFGTDFHYWTEQVTNPRFQGWNSFFTTSQAVNVHLSTGSDVGRFYRFTSSKRYKTNISYEEDFSHLPIPSSARWMDKPSPGEEEADLTTYVGYIAEDWAELDPRFAVYGPEGTVENIVDRSIMAVLGDHIKALEARVAELEGQLG